MKGSIIREEGKHRIRRMRKIMEEGSPHREERKSWPIKKMVIMRRIHAFTSMLGRVT
jgi:hypothetical protein